MSGTDDTTLRPPAITPYLSHSYKKYQRHKSLYSLPSNLKNRVRALRKLQQKVANIEMEYHKRVYELELQMEKECADLFSKRRKIVSGEHEPSEEEYTMPIPYYENYLEEVGDVTFELADGNTLGIPGFWLSILKYLPLFDSMLRETDEPALMHLKDIRFNSKPLPDASFTLEFHFSPNGYFSNSVLTKEYFLKYSPDEEVPLQFDGPEIYYCRGCTINWFDGKDLTKPPPEIEGDYEAKLRLTTTQSFFNFFDTYVNKDEIDLEPETITKLESDFEIGQYMKERVIPRAVLYYTAETDDLSENSSDDDSGEYYVSENEV